MSRGLIPRLILNILHLLTKECLREWLLFMTVGSKDILEEA